jgi:hypothetical protein
MSEELDLMLPTGGGEESPAAGAPPAAPPQGDDAASRSASEAPPDSGTPVDPNAAPVAEGEQPKAKGVQKRLNELVSDREREARRADQATDLLKVVLQAALTPQQAAQQQAAQQGERPPRAEDYGNNWQEYDRAQRAYEARAEARRLIAEDRAQQAQAHQSWQQQQNAVQVEQAKEQLQMALGSEMRAAATRYPDYEDVISAAPVNIPVNLQAAMLVSGFGGDVAYHLAMHPQLIPRLARMPDMQLSSAIAKIGFALRSGPSNSNAPPASRPARGSGTADLGYPKDATPEQHEAWKKRNQAAQQKRA